MPQTRFIIGRITPEGVRAIRDKNTERFFSKFLYWFADQEVFDIFHYKERKSLAISASEEDINDLSYITEPKNEKYRIWWCLCNFVIARDFDKFWNLAISKGYIIQSICLDDTVPLKRARHY